MIQNLRKKSFKTCQIIVFTSGLVLSLAVSPVRMHFYKGESNHSNGAGFNSDYDYSNLKCESRNMP